MPVRRAAKTFLTASLILFMVQSLRILFSTLFGIIYDQIFEGPMSVWLLVSNLLVLAAFLLPVLAPKGAGRVWMATTAGVAAFSRVALVVNQAPVRFWGSLAVMGAAGLYLAAALGRDRRVIYPSLLAALIADQFFRAAGDTYDLTLWEAWRVPQALWAGLLLVTALWLVSDADGGVREIQGMGYREGIALGGFLFLQTSLLSLPNAMARWTDTPYPLIAPAAVLATGVGLQPGLRAWAGRRLRRRGAARILAAALVIGGVLMGYAFQGPLVALTVLLADSLLVLLLWEVLKVETTGGRRTGLALAAGLFGVWFLNFYNAFTFTYPYTVPALRGFGWVGYLLALLSVGLYGLVRKPEASPAENKGKLQVPALLFPILVSLCVVWFVRPLPPAALEGDTLFLGTYNIHYGYDDEWRLTLKEQVRTLQAEGLDAVALQEVDTGRLTSYGVDNAYYLARQLGMQAAYQPTVEHLTGIAVLYKGPVRPVETRLLASRQEQTGIIHVPLAIGNSPVHMFGVWLGLSDEDTGQQVEESLSFIGARSPAAFGGDFNARPEEAVPESVRAAGFVDPFIELGIDPPPTSPAINPRNRIDYVWLRDLDPVRAWVSDSLASDHRLVIVEAQPR